MLDETDIELLRRLTNVGAHLRLRELVDDPPRYDEKDLVTRLEALEAAGYVRQVRYFRVTLDGAEHVPPVYEDVAA